MFPSTDDIRASDQEHGFCAACHDPCADHVGSGYKCVYAPGCFVHGGFFRLDVPLRPPILLDTITQARSVARNLRAKIRLAPKLKGEPCL